MGNVAAHNEVSNMDSAKFVVYFHMRPDGTPFYVGKGVRSRAYDFAPSRRTLHHKNIVAKYGRENIGVRVINCMYEAEAFALERAHISLLRMDGVELVNLTNGGEGATGRKLSSEQLERHKEAVRRGWDKRGRLPRKENKEILAFPMACKMCESIFHTKNKSKRFCDDNCQQRHSRSLLPKNPIKKYKNNTTGITGVYHVKKSGKWLAMIGSNRTLKCLGTYENKEDAVKARRKAEEHG